MNGDFIVIERAAEIAAQSARIAVIGNTCSGKTAFSNRLKNYFDLPLLHVDSVQYLQNLMLRDPNETRTILKKYAENSHWIIDGVGPLKILEDRLEKADLIVVVRPAILVNLYYLLKRQFSLIFGKRPELPAHENSEATPSRTVLLLKHMFNVHRGLWPQLDRILKSEKYSGRVVTFRASGEIDQFFQFLHHSNSQKGAEQ